ncbi:MAG: hypothetical protein LBR95_10145 [Azoarcus sp.]|jgi:hypothetical protein|nr:hypothetical protein [Azoarcus sp.]
MPIAIRAQHHALLQKRAFEAYITELIEYGEDTQPGGFLDRLSEERLREILKTVCAKSEASFGFDQRGPIHGYLDLVWVYGWDFESDPQYQWVIQTKKANEALTQVEQADILFDEMQDYEEAVNGDEFQYRNAFIKNFQVLNVSALPVREATFVPDMLCVLHDLYPQKYERANEQALAQLITEERSKAAGIFGFHKPHHQGLIVILAFLLGHEFHRNPFLDWPKPADCRQPGFDVDEAACKVETFARDWFIADC